MDSKILSINEAVRYARQAFAPYKVETLVEDKDSVEVTVRVDNYAVRVAHLDRRLNLDREQYLSEIQTARMHMRGIGAHFEEGQAG